MIDYYIFGFGLIVTLVVGSGLASMIVANNRATTAAQVEPGPEGTSEPVPVRVRSRS